MDNGREQKQLKALLSTFAVETEVESSTEGLQQRGCPTLPSAEASVCVQAGI